MPYTNLNNNGYKDQALAWNGMYLSSSTKMHRDQLKHGLDDFTNFYWRGVDAFETFGAFIINNKNSLKFYNGPSYSNEYSKPQFESAAGQLTGVTFQIQKIDFTIGVYWINEKDYRQLINWLNPYEINTLCFDFEPNYYYQVKLASVADGTRTVVGKEFRINYKGTFDGEEISFSDAVKPAKCTKAHQSYRLNHVYNAEGKDIGRAIDEEYEYYTEIKLTFEIQGPACAYNKLPYIFNRIPLNDDDKEEYENYDILKMGYSDDNLIDPSDLEVPVKIIYDIDTNKITESLELSSNQEYNLSLEAYAYYLSADGLQNEVVLFSTALKNISYLLRDNAYAINGHLMLEYDSESGLLFLLNGDGDYFLLNTLTTSSQGRKILDFLVVNKYVVAGKLNYYNFDWHNLELNTYAKITSDEPIEYKSGYTEPKIFGNDCQVIVRGRTNLI